MLLKKGKFRFNSFVFDTDEGVLAKDGKPIPLPPKAIELLSVLVINHGRIVEKEELLSQVWGDTYVEEGNVAYTVRLLRKALGDDADAPTYIETVPRRGYRFIAYVQPSKSEDEDTGNSTLTTLRSDKTTPNNLPFELKRIIGREIETEQITSLLSRPDVRLVTITGAGGTGKTTIAHAFSRESLAEFPDGVYFIDLSTTERVELVAPVIAQTLGIRERSGKTLTQCPYEYLGQRQILFVLDNFEQVISAALHIGAMLSDCPNIKFLITSRVRLDLSFEHEFNLQPLEVPIDRDLSLTRLREFPAIELFIARAQQINADFALTEGNAYAIAEICRRLDGLPLAIELVVGRMKLFAPETILSKLSNSLHFLTGGARDLPARQQTMRAAIQWSYDLLEDDEKRLLNRLGVFAGGFSLAAAGSVVNSQGGTPDDQIDGLASLVDKSLISRREMINGELRFRMLAVVREFALDHLVASGEADEVRRLHAAFYARLSEAAEPELHHVKAAEWMDLLEEERENLRLAVDWGLEHDPDIALRIAGSIEQFWCGRGYLSEGRNWLEAVIDKSDGADANLRAKAYIGAANIALRQGDLDGDELFLAEILRLSRENGDKYWLSRSLGGLGTIKTLRGDRIQGMNLIEESLRLARELNNQFLISKGLNRMGQIARIEGDYLAARAYCEEAFTIAKVGSLNPEIPTLAGNVASAACLLKDYSSARAYAVEGLKSSEASGDKIGLGFSLNIFAALAVANSELGKAARLYGAAQALFDSIDFKVEYADRKFNELYLDMLQASISSDEFEAAFEEGQSMTLTSAVAFALASAEEHEKRRKGLRLVGRP